MSAEINQQDSGLGEGLLHLWHHLSRRRRWQYFLLLVLMVVSAFAEAITLGAVLPFLGVLMAPESVFDATVAGAIAQSFGITSADQMVLPLTIVFIVAILMAATVRMLLLWASTRLTFASGADLGSEVYRRTLYQPYDVHSARNSSEIISGITVKVNGVVFGVMLPLATLVSSIVLLVFVGLALIVIEPFVALAAVFGFGAVYLLISRGFRRRLRRNSLRIATEQTQVVKVLQEGLGGIRDVLLNGTQSFYYEAYRKADYPLRRAQGNNIFLAGSPRNVIEALATVTIAGFAYALSRQPDGIALAVPMLGALALGAQRLLPALQRSFGAWATITGNRASLYDVVELLNQPLPKEAQATDSDLAPLPFKSAIRFCSLRFRYADDGPWVLDRLDLTIPKGARFGFVGSTGGGKTTTMDLLMGLLEPTEGEIQVDGEPISGDRLRSWQMSIAHVPQSIYLADATMAENIAFGVPPGGIDMERVRKAARQALIDDFIESRPGGYRAFVGERGIRLSGGQRQRVGIARALYKHASVLVFDEATSALDNTTERAVMDAVQELDRDLTILLVAHRLTTVQGCDMIVELERGQVAAQGSYEQLIQSSAGFRNMVGVTEQDVEDLK